MKAHTEHFYSNLHISKLPLHELLLRKQLFNDIPADWHVIITDIKSSTIAVNSGLHETVNLIATGSMVTVLNIAFKANISIPFFFGGDGATFLVPDAIVDKALKGLSQYKANTLNNFNLDLRVGVISVKEIYDKAHRLSISRFSASDNFVIPVILGDGLEYAEKQIKGEDYLLAAKEYGAEDIDLTGMQCRWDKIAPPENMEEVVTLIVIAKQGRDQASAFSRVIKHIDQIYGTPEKRQPISIPKLIFKTSFNNLGREMRHRIGKLKWLELIKTWFINIYGYIYFRTDSGKKYLKQLVEMSDTLVMDGRINTVITGSEEQRLRLQTALNILEQKNEILYGLYVSKESVMSCYVRDLEDDHIHFVDGSDGGYTRAAALLKQKIREGRVI
ncbi:DUF3095 domain-containing protein [Pedobacter sp. BMA]|uniref:DUF3095 domain-containing protein n=1 Tax=Pedobacter sp. BMA TaxID=1663685 RepID=UPI00064B589F|nr:DUF3095 domain-containing protein [Pedobacter sp. BMA]KLT66983.1 hypothetical protein AB669_03410 [Pedobacter sp. BMA]